MHTLYLFEDTNFTINIVTQWETDWLDYLHTSYRAGQTHLTPMFVCVYLKVCKLHNMKGWEMVYIRVHVGYDFIPTNGFLSTLYHYCTPLWLAE